MSKMSKMLMKSPEVEKVKVNYMEMCLFGRRKYQICQALRARIGPPIIMG